MELNEKKKNILKQMGFKVKPKKSCDPKWFNEINENIQAIVIKNHNIMDELLSIFQNNGPRIKNIINPNNSFFILKLYISNMYIKSKINDVK